MHSGQTHQFARRSTTRAYLEGSFKKWTSKPPSFLPKPLHESSLGASIYRMVFLADQKLGKGGFGAPSGSPSLDFLTEEGMKIAQDPHKNFSKTSKKNQKSPLSKPNQDVFGFREFFQNVFQKSFPRNPTFQAKKQGLSPLQSHLKLNPSPSTTPCLRGAFEGPPQKPQRRCHLLFRSSKKRPKTPPFQEGLVVVVVEVVVVKKKRRTAI